MQLSINSILENEYKMTLLSSHKKSIELVLKKRSDMAIVTRSYLNQYLNKYPESKKKLLISERVAQTYKHHVNYVHFNPLKHGLVERVVDWPYSSFHKAVASGMYSRNWCGE